MLTLVTRLRAASCGATTAGRAWRRRAHLCDLAWLAEQLVSHDEKPVRDLARTLVSEARRASLTRARWMARLAQAFGLELAAMIEVGPVAAAAHCITTIYADQLPLRPAALSRAEAPTLVWAAGEWRLDAGGLHLGAHYCHAEGCKQPTPASRLMCGRHWRRVPPSLRRAVLRAYRAGQEADKSPSPAWLAAARAAIDAVKPKRFGAPAQIPAQESSRR